MFSAQGVGSKLRADYPQTGVKIACRFTGLDVRRENLRQTTIRKLLRERNARQGWAKKAVEKKKKKKAKAA